MRYGILLMVSISILFANIDINKATVEKLSSLKGIGLVKAQGIVNFRKGHCFKTIDELRLVKGIGKKIIEKNIKELKVSSCKKQHKGK